MGVGMGCARSAPVITDPKNDTVSQLIKRRNEQKKHTLEPKQWVAIVWAHVPSKIDHLWPLAALSGMGVGVGVVVAGGDGVVVVIEV